MHIGGLPERASGHVCEGVCEIEGLLFGEYLKSMFRDGEMGVWCEADALRV